ncbi:MAG: hypothetical protein MJ200_02255 [Mycoplasmoidaceae bacterium]|nr:hypothetical protein [Mycoplasmoidaceae bacterium]
MEILGLVVLLLGCISLAFTQVDTTHDFTDAQIVAGPMIVSTLAFAINGAVAGLTYHNYK